MFDQTPTGKRRHIPVVISKWFGKNKIVLVLQEECTGIVPEYCGGQVDCRTVTFWRNVTTINYEENKV